MFVRNKKRVTLLVICVMLLLVIASVPALAQNPTPQSLKEELETVSANRAIVRQLSRSRFWLRRPRLCFARFRRRVAQSVWRSQFAQRGLRDVQPDLPFRRG